MCSLIEKCTILTEVVNNRRQEVGHMEASVLSSQIFCKSKTIVKLKVYFKKEIPILRMKEV